MKIISIDVGIKNLAFCLLTQDVEGGPFKITLWDTINLSQPVEAICGDKEKGLICAKPAKFMKHSKCYCLKHAKKQPFQIPTPDLKPSFINKQKVKTLYELANKYNIKYETPIKKADLIILFNEYISNTCLEPVVNVNASKIDLVTIGRNIQLKMDSVLVDHISTIDMVIIENQISPIANRMKTIQGMIAQYFIMKNNNIEIDFINASNKLKDCHDIDKNTYSNRKKMGIQYSLELLTTTIHYSPWKPFFEKHAKKDDLADAFLQAQWFINNKCTIKDNV